MCIAGGPNVSCSDKAVEEAKAAGSMVFAAEMPDLYLSTLTVRPLSDKDDPGNYDLSPSLQGYAPGKDRLWVTTSGRTGASVGRCPMWSARWRSGFRWTLR